MKNESKNIRGWWLPLGMFALSGGLSFASAEVVVGKTSSPNLKSQPAPIQALMNVMDKQKNASKSKTAAASALTEYQACAKTPRTSAQKSTQSACLHNAQLLVASYPSLKPQFDKLKKEVSASSPTRKPAKIAPPLAATSSAKGISTTIGRSKR